MNRKSETFHSCENNYCPPTDLAAGESFCGQHLRRAAALAPASSAFSGADGGTTRSSKRRGRRARHRASGRADVGAPRVACCRAHPRATLGRARRARGDNDGHTRPAGRIRARATGWVCGGRFPPPARQDRARRRSSRLAGRRRAASAVSTILREGNKYNDSSSAISSWLVRGGRTKTVEPIRSRNVGGIKLLDRIPAHPPGPSRWAASSGGTAGGGSWKRARPPVGRAPRAASACTAPAPRGRAWSSRRAAGAIAVSNRADSFSSSRNPDHSDFHVTLKLPPSDARVEGAAVTLLPFSPVLVEMDSCTALPKSVIGPETDRSVAVSVPPLTPV